MTSPQCGAIPGGVRFRSTTIRIPASDGRIRRVSWTAQTCLQFLALGISSWSNTVVAGAPVFPTRCPQRLCHVGQHYRARCESEAVSESVMPTDHRSRHGGGPPDLLGRSRRSCSRRWQTSGGISFLSATKAISTATASASLRLRLTNHRWSGTSRRPPETAQV